MSLNFGLKVKTFQLAKMETDILKNNFEEVYKEYKDYEQFVLSSKEAIETGKEEFRNIAVSGELSDSELVNRLFDLSIKPLQSDLDLRILRDRMVSTYDAYKVVIDFPEEIKEEIRNIIRPVTTYRIVSNKQEEVDPVKNKIIIEEAKVKHLEVIEMLKNT